MGIPASGKSTWAKEYVKQHPNTLRVNKDDLRAMLHNGVHTKDNEKLVNTLQDEMVFIGLTQGKTVVVDNTHLNIHHYHNMKKIAKQAGAEFELMKFPVTLEEAIARDSRREKSVGEEVIRRIYEEFKAHAPKEQEQAKL